MPTRPPPEVPPLEGVAETLDPVEVLVALPPEALTEAKTDEACRQAEVTFEGVV